MSGQKHHDCQYCDGPGGEKTYANQVPMPLNGKVQTIDQCIAGIVAALNAGGIWTQSCCCGHCDDLEIIELVDGRWLTITKEKPEWFKAKQRPATIKPWKSYC